MALPPDIGWRGARGATAITALHAGVHEFAAAASIRFWSSPNLRHAAGVPIPEVRLTLRQRPMPTSESKDTSKPMILVPL
jgi:hypothetical protein